jgi:hypothetical protein
MRIITFSQTPPPSMSAAKHTMKGLGNDSTSSGLFNSDWNSVDVINSADANFYDLTSNTPSYFTDWGSSALGDLSTAFQIAGGPGQDTADAHGGLAPISWRGEVLGSRYLI